LTRVLAKTSFCRYAKAILQTSWRDHLIVARMLVGTCC